MAAVNLRFNRVSNLPYGTLRFFNCDEDGCITFIDTSTMTKFAIGEYMNSLDDERASSPISYTLTDQAGNQINPAAMTVGPAATAQFLHMSEIERFTMMICRAQDACSELTRTIPAWLAALADVKKVNERVPVYVATLLSMTPLVDDLATRMDQPRGDTSQEPSFETRVQVKEDELKADLARLPAHATLIAVEFRRLTKNDAARIQGPSQALKDMAREVIGLKATVEKGISKTEHIIERAQLLITS